jgi:diaminopimelate epimerase
VIFYKTSSFGNDFIVVDGESLPGGMAKGDVARAICDRQQGVGADGVVYYLRRGRALRFEIYNRDGGAAELSGNGMAGLAAVLIQRRLAASPLTLQSGIGPRRVALLERRGPLTHLDVEIGHPDFGDRGFFPFLERGRMSYRAAGVEFHPVSVGNPHAVVVCRKLPPAARLAALGKKLECHPLFPRRVNVEFVSSSGAEACQVYYYERGVGPTQASSTGSAAVFAVLRRLKMAGERLRIERAEPAAGIQIRWQDGIHVRILTRLVCRGEYYI